MAPSATSDGVNHGVYKKTQVLNRADEVDDLLNAVKSLIIPFIRSADHDAALKSAGNCLQLPAVPSRTVLVDYQPPEKLTEILNFYLPPGDGLGRDGLLETVQNVLKYSVNTWDQGFLDKLYASTNAVGVVSELLLAVLNTNVHVYQVSPALTVIEKTTTRALASKFGFNGLHAGGISTQGGSASNTTALIIARNTLYPETKLSGNGSHNFILFTSAHGHYSLEKAALISGFGTKAVCSVPVDPNGSMNPQELEKLIKSSIASGKTPLFVNATAGSTVLGSYDPILAISQICKSYKIWFHVDGSFGGAAIFSTKQKHKLNGSHLADSLAMNPHKMLGVPITCSFLLGRDMRQFHKANTLHAGYLFHGEDQDEDQEVWDLADLTLQCGRRGDSLKLALSWVYYGSAGYERQIDHAFDVALYFASSVAQNKDFVLVSENPPPCLQVCFYYAPDGHLGLAEDNTAATKVIVKDLVRKGFMVDYAPGERGSFLRVVVNVQTRKETIDGLMIAIQESGVRSLGGYSNGTGLSAEVRN